VIFVGTGSPLLQQFFVQLRAGSLSRPTFWAAARSATTLVCGELDAIPVAWFIPPCGAPVCAGLAGVDSATKVARVCDFAGASRGSGRRYCWQIGAAQGRPVDPYGDAVMLRAIEQCIDVI
jgi:hypothetical protein